MELLIMDQEFNGIRTLDIFESLIWTDRYYEAGDFELYIPASKEMIDVLQEDLRLYNRDSEHIMIIEDVQIETDVEDGAHLTVTGRSLESLLERRIIWNQTTLSGSLQDGIEKLLNENVINPSDPARKIDNVVFKKSSDTKITNLSLNAQYWGENLYDTIKSICESAEIGWKMALNDSNQMVFSLYAGTDRSYNQTANPYIIFSPSFDNLLNSNYISSKKTLKTVTMVTGEGEGTDKKYTVAECSNGAGSGLNRREMYTDASSISQTDGENTIPDDEYLNLLKQKGIEDLAQNLRTKTFEGEVTSGKTYTYGVDYFMGDVVQNVNEYGVMATSRVIEYVMSQDTTGLEMYPTFASEQFSSLPEGYTQVEYIESHGYEYIDTGFNPNQDTKMVADFMITNPSASDVFGYRDFVYGTNMNTFTFSNSGSAHFSATYGKESVTFSDEIAVLNNRVTVVKNRKNISVNGTTMTTSDQGKFSSAHSMYIFDASTENGSVVGGDNAPGYTSVIAKLYSFKIYSSSDSENDMLVRDFIPVKNSNGEYGLWDLVNEKFYGNISGNGSFTGPQ